jgi:hypothetical protein
MCVDSDLYLDWGGKLLPIHREWKQDLKAGQLVEFVKRGGMRYAEPPSYRPTLKIKRAQVVRHNR